MDIPQLHGRVQAVKDEVGIKCQNLFLKFLEEYQTNQKLRYLEDAKELIKPERKSLWVSFADVEKFNQTLATIIIEDYYSAVNIFVHQKAKIKVEKNFYVSFTDVATRHKVRELSTAKVGTLLKISGQVVRTHPVHPELVNGVFKCLDCQTIIKDVEQQFKYTLPTICANPVCQNRTRFSLEISKSRFVDFQKVRIQETQAELPRGCIPRSVEVILRAEAVEMAQAGDRCDFTGTLIVVPDVAALSLPGARAESMTKYKREQYDMEGVRGLKSLGVRELSYRLAFLACSVVPTHLGGQDFRNEELTAEIIRRQMTDAEWARVYEMSRNPNLYQHLVNSLFPAIHGNDEVKRGIVLMLFGGVPKCTQERTMLRGDINVCIIGDPSTAKSQLLKRVTEFTPRAVYTSGKASSAAGLTAAVVRDEESGEFVIEAGALMLADGGVCCIDEFDKMEVRDQVAIHEAMEQQTISITKAGVRATLNARTSILAAANPIGGQYDRTKSLRQNVSLSAPIMSRFDLFFVLIDECNEVTDYAIARRIVELHSGCDYVFEQVYSTEDIQRYLLFARQFRPCITTKTREYLITQYRQLRQRDAGGSFRSAWRVTVRQLESMIRLSEAMARLYCCDEVLPRHAREACRLLSKSIIRVEQPDIALDENEEMDDVGSHNCSLNDDLDILPPTPRTPDPSRQILKLSFKEYKTISTLLVLHLKSEEANAEESGHEAGLHRSQVINWYLNEVQAELESEADLLQRKVLIEKILDRLIYHDQVIIPLMQKTSQKDDDDDPLLVCHPNFVLDD